MKVLFTKSNIKNTLPKTLTILPWTNYAFLAMYIQHSSSVKAINQFYPRKTSF